jgi:hypothetical protein
LFVPFLYIEWVSCLSVYVLQISLIQTHLEKNGHHGETIHQMFIFFNRNNTSNAYILIKDIIIKINIFKNIRCSMSTEPWQFDNSPMTHIDKRYGCHKVTDLYDLPVCSSSSFQKINLICFDLN